MTAGLTRVALAVIALLYAGPLAAQVSSLKQHNTDAPIDVDAQRIEVRDKDNLALLNGAVKIRQGDLTLDADSVRIFYRRNDGQDPTIIRLDADGISIRPNQRRGRKYLDDPRNRTATTAGARQKHPDCSGRYRPSHRRRQPGQSGCQPEQL